jgi:hypothetical protein
MHPIALLTYLVWSMTIVAFEGSRGYGEAALSTVVAVWCERTCFYSPGGKDCARLSGGPRARRPTFANWTNLSMAAAVSTIWVY